jgi:formimidoylglutamate deiminase
VGLSPFEEIRLLDYTNRLKSNKRDTFKNSKSANSGEIALQAIYNNGHKSMGNIKSDYFDIGGSLDFLDIDHNHPLIYNSSEKNLLNTIIYSTDTRNINNAYTKGKKRVNDKGNIIANYNNAIKNIKNY